MIRGIATLSGIIVIRNKEDLLDFQRIYFGMQPSSATFLYMRELKKQS